MGQIVSKPTNISVKAPAILPAWITNQPQLFTWIRLTNTKITGVGAGMGVTSYSGAIWDPVRKQIVINGGGHSDSDNNGVYAVKLGVDTPIAVMLRAQSTSKVSGTVSGYNPDGLPIARHTYYHIQYSSKLNAMMQLGAASLSDTASQVYPQCRTVNAFYLDTNTWSKAGDFPNRPGPYGGWYNESGCEDHLGNMYIWDNQAGSLQKLSGFSRSPFNGGTWSQAWGGGFAGGGVLLFDTKRQRFVAFDEQLHSYYTYDGVKTNITFSGTGANIAKGNSWSYCPQRDSFIGIDWGTTNVYECSAELPKDSSGNAVATVNALSIDSHGHARGPMVATLPYNFIRS